MNNKTNHNYDVIIIGAGAAGMMCARQAALRGRRVAVIEHTAKTGEKIRISGGGRCNFTNIYARPETFISQNPHFCKSALARYTPQDFINLVDAHNIAWHEKPYEDDAHESAKGQLFCDGKSTQIIAMLYDDARQAGADFYLETKTESVRKERNNFFVETDQGVFQAASLVIASGGLSIPKIGASPFAYKIAEQFGLNIITPRAGLVPLTFAPDLLAITKELSGVAITAQVKSRNGKSFTEGFLFTHRGLSGPSILQISSYWQEGEDITVTMVPERDIFAHLKEARHSKGKQKLQTVLAHILPGSLAEMIAAQAPENKIMGDLSDDILKTITKSINHWDVKPQGSEGYRTAEVTLGGIDTNELSSKTMEARNIPGLYFIGEAVDVTGHLGGHNFQWAWSSAVAAGDAV